MRVNSTKEKADDEPTTPRIHVLQDNQTQPESAKSILEHRKELGMIVVDCKNCGKRRLLDLNSLTSLESTDIGIRVTYKCSCDGQGSMLLD